MPKLSEIKLNVGSAAVVAAYCGSQQVYSSTVTLSAPSGLDWTPPITVNKTGSAYATTFDVTSLIPVATKTYYVDPVSGNDANAGTTRGAPLQKLSIALAKADADQIRIINLAAHYVAFNTFGWNGTQPAKSVAVINESSTYRFLSCRTSSSAAPTWTVNGTYANVYQTTISSSNSTDVADAKFLDTPSWTDENGNQATSAVHPPVVRRLTKVASLAAVAASAGTWYNDGTNTYVRAHDDRSLVGDTKMLCLVGGGNNGRPNLTTNNLTLYVQGVDFIGGQGFQDTKLSTVTGQVIAFSNCSFQAAGSAQYGGMQIKANSLVYSYRCAAYNNGSDGFNYHSQEADATTTGTSPKFVEIECLSYGNGQWGSANTTDNATTCHDECRGLRLNGIYPDSSDRPLHDIDKSKSWNLGCFIGPAKDSALPSVVAGIGSSAGHNAVWLDGCTIRSGANPKVRAETGSAIYYANMGSLTNDVGAGGTVSAYTP